jgi:hypothetical protein
MNESTKPLLVPSHSNRTPKVGLFSWILQALKRLILHESSPGAFTWGADLQAIPSLWVEDRTGKRVFCPLLPGLIYLLMTYLLRSGQARWLDSGELDGFVLDFTSGSFVRNTQQCMSTRAQGVLQPLDSVGASRERSFKHHNCLGASELIDGLCFQVAVGQGGRPYCIPYVPPEIPWVVSNVLAWQRDHGIPPFIHDMVEENVLCPRSPQPQDGLIEGICPLFRYPGNQSHPPTIRQVERFWAELCGQWDCRATMIQSACGDSRTTTRDLPKLTEMRTSPGRPAGVLRAKYSLADIRRSGIAALVDSGLAYSSIAGFTGHHSAPALALPSARL